MSDGPADKRLDYSNLELLEKSLPSGLRLARSIEGKIVTPEDINKVANDFADGLIKEFAQEADPFRVVIPVSGGLFIYFTLLEKLKSNPDLLKKIEFVFGIEFPKGSKSYVLTNSSGKKKKTYVPDDIWDTGGSFRGVEAALGDTALGKVISRNLSTKEHVLSQMPPNGDLPYHVFRPEWITTCFGMNSGIGEKAEPGARVYERRHEIAVAERMSNLPVAIIEGKMDEINNWSDKEIDEYLDILSHFQVWQEPVRSQVKAFYQAINKFYENPLEQLDLPGLMNAINSEFLKVHPASEA